MNAHSHPQGRSHASPPERPDARGARSLLAWSAKARLLAAVAVIAVLWAAVLALIGTGA